MPKVLLVNTSFPTKEMNVYSPLTAPLGLLSIASPLLRFGYEVELIDPQIHSDYMEKIEREISKKPILVGMSTFMGSNVINALKISRYIKKISPNMPIVWGGAMATSSPELCLRESPVDYIVMGMGEETIVNLAQTLENGGEPGELPYISSCTDQTKAIKEIYSFTGNLDELHYPQLKLWKKGIRKMDSIPILSSRGCPRNCAFCYNNTFTGRKKWYGRSAQNVIDEMDYWAMYFKIKNFYFVDDNFLVNTARACCILEKTIERNYKIGQILGHLHDFKPDVLRYIFGYIDHVGFSIEAASPKIQRLLNKIINLEKALDLIAYFSEKGIEKITTNFMFGLPTETDEDIAANINMALKIRNINNKVRIIPFVYTPQPEDDIIPQFEFYDKIGFSIETLSTIDLAPNRSNILSHEIRPWMSKEDIEFYLDLVLVWFYHFDHVVRKSQDIHIEAIYKKNKRLHRLFKHVPMLE